MRSHSLRSTALSTPPFSRSCPCCVATQMPLPRRWYSSTSSLRQDSPRRSSRTMCIRLVSLLDGFVVFMKQSSPSRLFPLRDWFAFGHMRLSVSSRIDSSQKTRDVGQPMQSGVLPWSISLRSTRSKPSRALSCSPTGCPRTMSQWNRSNSVNLSRRVLRPSVRKKSMFRSCYSTTFWNMLCVLTGCSDSHRVTSS